MTYDPHYALHLADLMDHQAEWREEKAGEYPDDAKRNLECAAEFREMAKRLRDFQGGPWYEKYCALCYADDEDLHSAHEDETMEMSSIHFIAMEPEEYYRQLVERVEQSKELRRELELERLVGVDPMAKFAGRSSFDALDPVYSALCRVAAADDEALAGLAQAHGLKLDALRRIRESVRALGIGDSA